MMATGSVTDRPLARGLNADHLSAYRVAGETHRRQHRARFRKLNKAEPRWMLKITTQANVDDLSTVGEELAQVQLGQLGIQAGHIDSTCGSGASTSEGSGCTIWTARTIAVATRRSTVGRSSTTIRGSAIWGSSTIARTRSVATSASKASRGTMVLGLPKRGLGDSHTDRTSMKQAAITGERMLYRVRCLEIDECKTALVASAPSQTNATHGTAATEKIFHLTFFKLAIQIGYMYCGSTHPDLFLVVFCSDEAGWLVVVVVVGSALYTPQMFNL
mmetsp:Transcript_18034/g.54216  ORF Transcript_18034/g.54216 Transcript_18034/m.54216 type:complete len:274 (-) Transcript_18034:62-883(-)